MDSSLVIELCVDDLYLSGLRKRGVPVVPTGRPQDTEVVMPCVDLQSAQISALLLAHLSASGARDIALFIGDIRHSAYQDTKQRLFALCDAVGIVPRVYPLNETNEEQVGFQVMLALPHGALQVDSVLILVDTFAAGVVRAFIQSGVSIPDEMHIATCYDGIRAHETWPGLMAMN